MRCIYCKERSDASRSVEHVIPQSLGNQTLVLSPGVVCDGCNNYFARKVEKPFLDAPLIRVLRHRQFLPGKRGRPLTMPLTVAGGGGAQLITTSREIPPQLMFDHAGELLRFLTQRHHLVVTEEAVTPPTDAQRSRLLAKIAMGYIAAGLTSTTGGIDYLVEEKSLDPLRSHARRGVPAAWPTSFRRIYSADASWRENDDQVQRVWEALVFHDDVGNPYFVLALFGWEFAIHIGEPNISGYQRWLLRQGGSSPLFVGRNAADVMNHVDTSCTRRQSRQILLGY